MKQLVEVIAKELVDYPEAVTVSEKETQGTIVLELKVAQEDMGKIIGKQGKIAKAIRTIVKSAAVSSEKKFVVEIMQ
ncbi:MAG: KH domain-containing protein [Cellulosilyticaceae bacterium]